MFSKLFKSNSPADKPQETVAEQPHSGIIEQRNVLYRYAFLLSNRKIFRQLNEIPTNPNDEFALAKKEVEAMGYNGLLDQVIFDCYDQSLEKNPDLRPDEFSDYFAASFHHCNLNRYCSEDTRKRNGRLMDAYLGIVDFIKYLQEDFELEELRYIVEQKLFMDFNCLSKMYQCTTAFCVISLGCDQRGNFNIVFSLDQQINQMIPSCYSSVLVRKIFDNTQEDLVPYLTFECLYADCVTELDRLMKLDQSDTLETNIIPLREEKTEIV